MKRRIVHTLLLAAVVTLSACGFQLRGANGQVNLPFKTIYLAGLPESSALGAELKRNIRASGDTMISTDRKTARATLEVLSESREKTVLSLNSQGRVREYSLFYKLRFHVKDDADKELLAPTEIVLKRDVSFNEAQVIAKEKEEDMLYRDMQSDLVQQVLRRLAALKPA